MSPVEQGAAPILEAQGLTKSFQGFLAVQDVDLTVRSGSIHAMIGPNGAGKTTVFNLLTKFLAPTAGRIRFKGRDITRLQPPDIARLGLVRSFQISATFPHLTVRENLRIALQRPLGTAFHFWKPRASLAVLHGRIDALLAQVGLQRHADWLAAALPYGYKRVLELATTLALEPELLLLDEPMAGLGHEDIDRIAELIRAVSQGRTTLMVEHNLSVVARLSDRITVLARGRVIAEGDYAMVSQDPQVVEAYLGAPDA